MGIFTRRKRDESQDTVSQCVSCRFCEKRRYGEDYFCRAKEGFIEFGSRVADCPLFEEGDAVVRFWRGRAV